MDDDSIVQKTAARAFKIGEVVRVKSGGLPMTVEEMRQPDPDFIDVVWFDGNNLHRNAFHASMLELCQPRS